MRRMVTWYPRLTMLVLLFGATSTAYGQMQPPDGTGPSLYEVSFPEIHAALQSTGAAPVQAAPVFPTLTFGVRAGVLSLSDGDADDVYSDLSVLGLDAKIHLSRLPLALQLSVDRTYGEGDLGKDSVILDSEADLTMYSARVSALLEPYPGSLGSEGGGFYVTPYVGAGLGLVSVREEVDAETTLGDISESASANAIDIHALAGVDLVLGRLISIGAQVLFSTARFENALDENVDVGGIGAFLTLRIHI